MYTVKRTYGTNHQNYDFLQYWDEEWGTACGGNDPQKALHFATLGDAEEACKKATLVIKGTEAAPTTDFKFVPHEIPKSDNRFIVGKLYYIGDSLSLWAYRGIESNLSDSKLHVFQCVEFDCGDEFEYYVIDNELSWIKDA